MQEQRGEKQGREEVTDLGLLLWACRSCPEPSYWVLAPERMGASVGVQVGPDTNPHPNPSDSHSYSWPCSDLASPENNVISACNPSKPVSTPHEPFFLLM